MIDLPGVPVIAAVDDATIEEEIRNSPPKLKKLRLSGPDDANDAGETTPSAAKKSRMSSSTVDEPFHGFLPSDVPARVVIIPDGDTDVSLTGAFGVELGRHAVDADHLEQPAGHHQQAHDRAARAGLLGQAAGQEVVGGAVGHGFHCAAGGRCLTVDQR